MILPLAKLRESQLNGNRLRLWGNGGWSERFDHRICACSYDTVVLKSNRVSRDPALDSIGGETP